MLRELVEKSRSYRGFDESRQVTGQELETMVACARLTPSSNNIQPLRYYLAWEPETVAAIQATTKWAYSLSHLNLPYPGKRPTAFIVICLDHSIDETTARFQRDVGIAAQTIMLAAAEMDLGGCMIGNFAAGDLRAALNLPEQIAPQLVLAIGKPAETVALTQIGEDGSTRYYRDEADTHYVPKRSLEDLLLN